MYIHIYVHIHMYTHIYPGVHQRGAPGALRLRRRLMFTINQFSIKEVCCCPITQ